MIMQDNEKKPALRFKGFTDPWEQRKVGELLTERNEQAPMSDEYPLMAFIANEGVAPKGERYDRSALVNDTASKLYKKTKFGDFIYSSNNLETGSIGLNKYGKASISPVYSIFKPTGIADSDFLGRRLIRKDFINEMVKWRQGVIYGQWRIHESDFIKIEVTVPTVEEQYKLGLLLDNLDTLITLHQRKYEKLLNIKKSMLDKMFPQNGVSVPEIRFKGFTDPWEQRKISELAEKTYGGGTPTTSNEAFWNGNIPWIQSSDIVDGKLMGVEPRKYITQTGLNNSATQLVPKDSIAIITRVGVGKLAYMPFSYSTSQDFLSLSKLNTEPFFTVYAEIKDLFVSAGIEEFSQIPADMAERKKFADLFQSFNENLEAAKVQGFEWDKPIVIINEDTDEKTELHADFDERTFKVLALRYKELFTPNPDGGENDPDDDVPYAVNSYLTTIDTADIDTDYMNSRFEKYLKIFYQEGAEAEAIHQAETELHKTFATLSQEEQKYANIFLHDIQSGAVVPQPGKTLREYIAEYIAQKQNDQIHKVAEVFGLDEKKLRAFMRANITEANINEFGRFDDLKATVDKAKAKAYFEAIEGTKLIPPKVPVKYDKLLREFIVSGGFDLKKPKES